MNRKISKKNFEKEQRIPAALRHRGGVGVYLLRPEFDPLRSAKSGLSGDV